MKHLKLLIVLQFAFCCVVYAQSEMADAKEIESISRSLSDHEYLDAVDGKVLELKAQGRYFEKSALIKALEYYKYIAWGNDKMKEHRTIYFALLGSNAAAQNKLGEAVYFFEKMGDERKIQQMPPSYHIIYQKCIFFNRNNQFKKTIEIFEPHRKYIDSLPGLIARNKIEESLEPYSIVCLLQEAGYAYARLNDSLNTTRLSALSKSILDLAERSKTIDYDNECWVSMYYQSYALEFFKLRYIIRDTAGAYKLLYKIRSLANDTTLPESSRAGLIQNSNFWLMDYFSFAGHVDSCRYYLELYKSSPVTSGENIKKFQSQYYEYLIWAIESGQTKYIPFTEQLLKEKEAINADLATELEDNLYAQTKAEYTALELEKAEKEKKNFNRIIVAIATLLLLAAIVIYRRIKAKSKKVQLQIATMNNVTNLKIAAMEEEKHEAVKEEQERIAQELHDDFSSMIAAAKSQAEVLKTEVANTDASMRMGKLSEQIQYIYEASRAKSHQWFYDARLKQQAAFTESLHLILDSALPQSQYQKNVQIDDDAVGILTFDDRIALLRILQEAIVNIIKHSKANEVSVFLFQSECGLIFEISDNGIGIDMQKLSKGLGLESIEQRVKLLNGTLTISNEDGTVMSIAFLPKS